MDLFGHMIGTWTSREHGSPPHPVHFKQHLSHCLFPFYFAQMLKRNPPQKRFYRLNRIFCIVIGCDRVTLIMGLPPRLTSFWIILSQIFKFSISSQAGWNNKCHPGVRYNLFWSEGHEDHVNWNIFVKFVASGFSGLHLGPRWTPSYTALEACGAAHRNPWRQILIPNVQVNVVFRPLWPNRALPHPITKIQNMRFRQ